MQTCSARFTGSRKKGKNKPSIFWPILFPKSTFYCYISYIRVMHQPPAQSESTRVHSWHEKSANTNRHFCHSYCLMDKLYDLKCSVRAESAIIPVKTQHNTLIDFCREIFRKCCFGIVRCPLSMRYDFAFSNNWLFNALNLFLILSQQLFGEMVLVFNERTSRMVISALRQFHFHNARPICTSTCAYVTTKADVHIVRT